MCTGLDRQVAKRVKKLLAELETESTLNNQELGQLRAVVCSFEDAFALNQLELGRTGLINTP